MKSQVLTWILRGVCFISHLTSSLCRYIIEGQTFGESFRSLTPIEGGLIMKRSSKLAGIVPMFAALIQAFMETVSPELRKLVVESLAKWEEKAKGTKNKWDDLIVDAAQAIFGVDE